MDIENLYQKPSAWKGHLKFAEWLIRKKQPKIFVELGSHWGHSYFAFCKSVVEAGLDTKCFAVDTWQGDSQAGRYNEEVYQAFISINENLFTYFSTPLRMTFDVAVHLFKDNSIGILHIDGLHTYENVKNDFEKWLPKMEENSIIIFHDTCEHKNDFGVWKLWKELKNNYPNHFEFKHSSGLGVLNISKKIKNLRDWIPGAKEEEITEFGPVSFSCSNIIQKIIQKIYFKKRTSEEPHFFKRLEKSLRKKLKKSYKNYATNIATFDRTSELKLNPLISVLMPCFNSNVEYLEKAINSVSCQEYTNWELCIADDASSDANVIEVIKRYSTTDNRIKFTIRDKNGHISEATNTALSMADGEWITFLDHDDMLSKNALFDLAYEINKNPNLKFIYTDEDKIDENENRHDPHFKSDWNPDLLFSQNYICHLVAINSEVLKKVNGFRKDVEGSQDYDLILRCLKFINADQIHHIPKILYHWRAVPGSTALHAGEKDYATVAGIKALEDYFNQSGKKCVVQKGPYPTTYRVKYCIPDPKPLVSLIIPIRDQLKTTKKCIQSILLKTDYKNYNFIIVDNQSCKIETQTYFNELQRRYNNIKVIKYDGEFNYSAINNFAVNHCSGSIIGLLNNDVEVISEEWLTEMVSHACRSEIGCVGAKLYYPNNTIQHAGVILGIGSVAGHSHKHYPGDHHGYFSRLKLTQNLSAVTGACLVVRKEVFKAVGGLDEDNLKIAFNDVDFCLKVSAAGYRNIWTPYAELFHHESVSRGHEDTPEKVARFNSEANYMIQKWGDKLLNDQYYNINLTLKKEDFSSR